MRVAYVSTEVFPALKTGGLADVNAALPGALIAAGADVNGQDNRASCGHIVEYLVWVGGFVFFYRF